jgi:3-oxoacyl-[acyl-carrier-protein] synthase III
MYVATEHDHRPICIASTARYVPKARVRPETLAQEPAAKLTSMREAVMRSVYADTLRWRQQATTPIAAYRPPRSVHPAIPTHVANEPHLSLSEMASVVASEAIRRYPEKESHVPDQIIVCGTSLEHDLALSCAGRLHSELGSTGVPFAIGQIQGVSFFLALQAAADMMASDDRMHTTLIVAAERWLPPFSRRTGSLTVLADGAAAVLARREARSGWHIRSLTVCTPTTSVSIPPQDICIDETIIVELIEQTCAQAGLKPAAFDWIVPPRLNTALACNVSAEAGLPVGRMWYPEPGDIGYLCAADTPAQLHMLLQTIVPAHGQHILLWSAGFQGQAACAVLEYRER